MKKGVYIAVFVAIALLFLVIISLKAITIIGEIKNKSLTGKATTGESVTGELVTGKVPQPFNVSVKLTPPLIMAIIIPENTTYSFNPWDDYTLNLNVTADFQVGGWWYTLLDLKNNITVNESVFFEPNITFNAVRWSNQLLVYANDSSGETVSASVTFYVSVPNVMPFIESLASEIFVCEGNSTSSYFNVTDFNREDTLEPSISPGFPGAPFFVYPTSDKAGTNVSFEVVSGRLNKAYVGVNNGWRVYEEIVSVEDNYNDSCCSDSENTNITVIELNNAPIIEDVGVKTREVWTRGENTTFYKQAQVTDAESGNQDSGNLTFNITILNSTGSVINLFNISSNGIMNFTANSSYIGVYNITLCAGDKGLINPHPNITDFCGQTGGNTSSCESFSLTVTNQSRAPTITSYYPLNLSSSISGSAYFNITKYDPDGTIPDAYWYINGVFQEKDSGSSVDEFTHDFCGVSGGSIVRVVITDDAEKGLNDSIQWNLTVGYVACPYAPPGGGEGRGGGAAAGCSEKLVCAGWDVCQNLKISLEKVILSGDSYRNVKNNCTSKNWDENFCGFQIRSCFDINNCSTANKTSEVQVCYYTEKPNCYDSIKNCHDGACEVLMDCGGPCLPCPTCSDKIQNQGEAGVDCGGPCPWYCPREKPMPIKKIGYFVLIPLIIIILLLIIIFFKGLNILKLKNKLKNFKWYYVSIFIVVIIALSVFYLYPRFKVGDFVHNKDKSLIGEIKNKSLTKFIVQWQDDSYSEEYFFSVGKTKELDEKEIGNILDKNNEQGISFFSWDTRGAPIIFGVKKAEEAWEIRNLKDLGNYSVEIGEKSCIPKFICGEWSTCGTNYNFRSMEEELARGEKYRYCKDSVACMSDFVQAMTCTAQAYVSIKRSTVEEKEYIEIYDNENKLSFKITKEEVEKVRKVDIEIFMDE